jgi:hypothetical protein
LSSILFQYVAAQDRERVFSGEIKLRNIPALDAPLRSLAAQLAAPLGQRIEPLRAISLMVDSAK